MRGGKALGAFLVMVLLGAYDGRNVQSFSRLDFTRNDWRNVSLLLMVMLMRYTLSPRSLYSTIAVVETHTKTNPYLWLWWDDDDDASARLIAFDDTKIRCEAYYSPYSRNTNTMFWRKFGPVDSQLHFARNAVRMKPAFILFWNISL